MSPPNPFPRPDETILEILERLNNIQRPLDLLLASEPDNGGFKTVLDIDDTDSPYSALPTDVVIICDATNGTIIVDLPPIATNKGKIYHVKKIDVSANAVTIDGNGAETIDGATTKVINTQYDSVMVVGGSGEWHVI